MALNSNALTTVNQFKLHLGMPNATTAEDARLELFINSASERIAQWCDRIFVSTEYTELHSGRRQNYLLPQQYPVTEIAEIRVSDSRAWTDAASLISDTTYVLSDFNSTIQYDGIFPGGFNNVRIVYTAGYITIPSDLEMACLWYCEWYYRHRTREDMGRTSKSKSDESVGILAQTPPMIYEILKDYQRCEFNNSESPVRNS